MRGIERRIEAGLDPKVRFGGLAVSSAAGMWRQASCARELTSRRRAPPPYRAYRELLASPRWRKLAEAGALPQRLLWASTGVKDKNASDVMYLEALAAPNTVNTIPKKTLLAFADHGAVSGSMPADGGDAEHVLAAYEKAGFDLTALAQQLQKEGADSFTKSWQDLMAQVESKSAGKAAA